MTEKISKTFGKLTVDEFLDFVFNSQEFWNYLFECANPTDVLAMKRILYRNEKGKERKLHSMIEKFEMLGLEVPEWLIICGEKRMCKHNKELDIQKEQR